MTPQTPQPHVYTVRQLIEALQKCANQDAPVNVYLLDNVEGFKYEDCGRYPVTFVDDEFDDHRMVDLNVTASLPYYEAQKKKEYDACTENN